MVWSGACLEIEVIKQRTWKCERWTLQGGGGGETLVCQIMVQSSASDYTWQLIAKKVTIMVITLEYKKATMIREKS